MEERSLTDTEYGSMQPSFIELFFKESLNNSFEPGLKYIFTTLSNYNKKFQYIYDKWDIVYPCIMSLIEIISLKVNESSIAETLFDIQRVNLRSLNIATTQYDNYNSSLADNKSDSYNIIRSYHDHKPLGNFKILKIVLLSTLIPNIFKYLKNSNSGLNRQSLDSSYNSLLMKLKYTFLALKQLKLAKARNLIFQIISDIYYRLRQNSSLIYNSLSRLTLFLFFVYRVLYLFDKVKWPYWDPVMHYVGLIYTNYYDKSKYTEHYTFVNRFTKFIRIMFLLVSKGFLLFEWVNANHDQLFTHDTVTILPEPPSHPKMPEYSEKLFFLIENKTICPLCNRTRTNPSCIPTGYVFCYRCILEYLNENAHCPITGIPVGDDQIRRLYESND